MAKYELRVCGIGVEVGKDSACVMYTYDSAPTEQRLKHDMAICLASQAFVAVRFIKHMSWEVIRSRKWAGVHFELVCIGE